MVHHEPNVNLPKLAAPRLGLNQWRNLHQCDLATRLVPRSHERDRMISVSIRFQASN